MKKALLFLTSGLILGLGTIYYLRPAESATAQTVAIVVATCGTATFVAGRDAPLTVSTTGLVCQ